MIDNIKKYKRSKQHNYTFSILIPTWNNLDYLKNCLESINQHSRHNHQIIVFVNDGSDGTLEWLNEHPSDNLDYIHSEENVGICYGVNLCGPMVKTDYILYMNDDMYVLPDWDEEISKVIDGLDTKLFMVSATMIEPVKTANNCAVVKDYGLDLDSFKKADLLDNYKSMKKSNWQGSNWPPVVVHVDTWNLVGGFSTEFSPGMYSDPDFSFKLLQAGVREFIGVGSSLVYHFGSKSTIRIKKNPGRKMFVAKWGITARLFRKKLLIIGKDYIGPLPEPDLSIRKQLLSRIKRIINSWT